MMIISRNYQERTPELVIQINGVDKQELKNIENKTKRLINKYNRKSQTNRLEYKIKIG